jgi:Sec-independent protein secretion pathway component TatC
MTACCWVDYTTQVGIQSSEYRRLVYSILVIFAAISLPTPPHALSLEAGPFLILQHLGQESK